MKAIKYTEHWRKATAEEKRVLQLEIGVCGEIESTGVCQNLNYSPAQTRIV